MPYDPTKPANDSPIVAAELRNQFAGLNEAINNLGGQIDDLPTPDEVLDTVNANSAGPCPNLANLNLTISNPPTQTQVQAIANKLDELITLSSRR
jgi:hypothetical protein